MNQLPYDEEDFFRIEENLGEGGELVLVIYDITDNRKRLKFSRLLEGYGKRVQRSAFEALLTKKKYQKLLEDIRGYLDEEPDEDSVRIYKIPDRDKVVSWGEEPEFEEEIILI